MIKLGGVLKPLVAAMALVAFCATAKAEWVWEQSGVTASAPKGWKAMAMSDNGQWRYGAGFESYIYVSSDNGARWTSKLPGGDWAGLACSADGAKVVGCSYPGHLRVSADHGDTWQTIHPDGAETLWPAVASSADGKKLAACNNNGSVYRSADFGATWTPSKPAGFLDDEVWMFLRSAADGSKLAGGTSKGRVYVSADSGATWTRQASFPANHDYLCGAMNWDGSLLGVGQADGDFYVSTDFGATWTKRGPAGAVSWGSCAISKDGSRIALVQDVGAVFYSRDGGLTWKDVSPLAGSQDWESVACSANGAALTVNQAGGQVFLSGDSGDNWTVAETGNYWLACAASADGKKLFVAGGKTFVHASSDAGVNWSAKDGSGKRMWSGLASDANGVHLAACSADGALLLSADSGATWTTSSAPDDVSWGCVTSSADGKELAAGDGDGGKIHVSHDYGATWQPRGEDGLYWSSIASSHGGGNLVATAFRYAVFTSADYGETWQQRDPSGGVNPWTGAACSADAALMYVCAEDDYIYASGDLGATWTKLDPTGEAEPWYAVSCSADGLRVVGVTDNGHAYLSTDAGLTWARLETGTARLWSCVKTSYAGDTIVAGVFGGNVFVGRDLVHPVALNVLCSPVGAAIVSPAAGTHHFEKGAVVNLTATPADGGLTFAGWASSAGAVVANPAALATTATVNRDAWISANFVTAVTAPPRLSVMLDNQGKNLDKIEVWDAALPGLPAGFDPIGDPAGTTVTAQLDGFTIPFQGGSWTLEGKSLTPKYVCVTGNAMTNAFYRLTLDTRKGVWTLSAQNAEAEWLNPSDGVAVKLRLNNTYYGGVYPVSEATWWNYAHQLPLDGFAVGKAHGNYHSDSEINDQFYIRDGQLGQQPSSFGDVTLTINGYVLTIPAAKFDYRGDGVYFYRSGFGSVPKNLLRVNLKKRTWSFSASKSENAAMVGDYGKLNISLKIGDTVGATSLDVRQRTLIRR